MRRRPSTRVVVAIALVALLGAGAALRAHAAATPRAYRSLDEKAYVHLAVGLADHGRYADRSRHWAPGAPLAFAAAYKLRADRTRGGHGDIPAAYWGQALGGTLLIAVAFALAGLLAGPVAGLAAAAAVAFYPPLIFYTRDLLSEPLGALALALALLALAWALGSRTVWRLQALSPRATLAWFALSGALFGAAALVRADLLPVPFLAAAAVALCLRRPARARRALASGGVLATGALAVVAPWCVHVSLQEGRVVPVTRAAGDSLFLGTYMPGSARKAFAIGALAPEIRRRTPALRGVRARYLDQRQLLAAVAARRPGLARDEALLREARANLTRYAWAHPLDYAGFALRKVRRLWFSYSHLGARRTEPVVTVLHVTLVLLAAAGLFAGAWRTRHPLLLLILALVAYKTLFQAILALPHPRYVLPLMPLLLVGGAAGAALALRGRAPAAERSDASLLSPAAP